MNGAQEIIDKFEAQVVTLEALKKSLSNVLLGQGWVVHVEGVYQKYEIVGGKIVGCRFCGVENATRFTERDAKAVASNTFNGNKLSGTAIHINDAVKQELEKVKGLLQTVKGGKQV